MYDGYAKNRGKGDGKIKPNIKLPRFQKETTTIIVQSLIAIIASVIVGGIVIELTGESALEAYKELLVGSLGSKIAFANTLSKTIPLVFTGLAVAITAKCGMLNIGAEGQLHLGAMASALIALTLEGVPKVIAISVCIVAGFIGGIVGGGIAGVMSSFFKVSEVIVAIMLNYVFILFTTYLAAGPFKTSGHVNQTALIPENARLVKIIPKTQLTSAIFFTLIVVILIYIFLQKTTLGYKLRSVGANRFAALTAGIDPTTYMIITMALSGGLAGLAGSTEVLGKYYRFIEGFSPSFGFTGIAIAILGHSNPFGVLATAFLFAILDTGALRMARVTNVSSNLVTVIQSLVIISVAAPQLFRFINKKRLT